MKSWLLVIVSEGSFLDQKSISGSGASSTCELRHWGSNYHRIVDEGAEFPVRA